MSLTHAARTGSTRGRSRTRQRLASLLAAGALAGCALAGCARGAADEPRTATAPPVGAQQFTAMPAAYTGVRFENQLVDDAALNVFTYRNFYNGGGVAIGDLTGDGLPELVLTANQGGPRLYLNEGRFRFRDVTRAAGVRTAKESWTTGVTLADVNGDGRLDMYICRAGAGKPAERANQLWINQGPGRDSVPTFQEKAAEYGVADQRYSTHDALL